MGGRRPVSVAPVSGVQQLLSRVQETGGCAVRVPIRHIAGHLVWSTQGSVWAVYRLHPGPDAKGQRAETVQGTYVPAAVRDEQLAKVTHLVRSLSGAPRLLGLCAQADPGEIALKMIEGIEPAEQAPGKGAHPWVENVEATLDLLEGQERHRRTLWPAVPRRTKPRAGRWPRRWERCGQTSPAWYLTGDGVRMVKDFPALRGRPTYPITSTTATSLKPPTR